LVDLGSSPPSNAYLTMDGKDAPEAWFPLRVSVCGRCWLVQTEDMTSADALFDSDYAYFSGFSSIWMEHCSSFASEAVDRFALGPGSHVVEVASNDGTLLRNFHDRGIPSTGIEPTASTAAAARRLGLHVVEEFLTPDTATALAEGGLSADLLMANNVLAHVPDIVGFATGCRLLLAEDGVASFEFPHLVDLVDGALFDTIYHEHFSYLSLVAVEGVFATAGLRVFDVERIPTHGGSLRVYAERGTGTRSVGDGVLAVREMEQRRGVAGEGYYAEFQERSERTKDALLGFLLEQRKSGNTVVGYGAAAKGNTLLNFAGVRPDLLPYVVDNNPAKQGRFLPGSRIPIVGEETLLEGRPECVLVLPWNLRDEVAGRLAAVADWSPRIVTAVPDLLVT